MVHHRSGELVATSRQWRFTLQTSERKGSPFTRGGRAKEPALKMARRSSLGSDCMSAFRRDDGLAPVMASVMTIYKNEKSMKQSEGRSSKNPYHWLLFCGFNK